MIAVAADIVDIPAAEGTILQNREASSYPRILTLRNLTTLDTISFKIQESADGGTTWSDLTLSDGTKQITLDAAGSGDDVCVERFSSANPLRIRASGGGNDRDLEVSLERVYDDASHVWGSPVL